MRPCSPCSIAHVASKATDFNKTMNDTKLLLQSSHFQCIERRQIMHMGKKTDNSCKTQWSCRRVSNLNLRSWQVKQHARPFLSFERRRRLIFIDPLFCVPVCPYHHHHHSCLFSYNYKLLGYREKKKTNK